MQTSELKKQLIEMIESIDDEEVLYLLKEDIVFHVTSKAVIYSSDNDKPAGHDLIIVK